MSIDFICVRPGPEVNMKDLSSVHMIDYDEDRDLLPLVISHCTYSLLPGSATQKVEYNFTALEQQVKEKFIYGKARIAFQVKLEYKLYPKFTT